MVSKELLQQTLGHLTVKEVVSTDKNRIDNNIYYTVNEIDILQSVNIYELAFKCKLWALNLTTIEGYAKHLNGFQLSTRLSMKDCYPYQCICEVTYYEKYKDNIKQELVIKIADSEPEAIFKACNYIMELNDGKIS